MKDIYQSFLKIKQYCRKYLCCFAILRKRKLFQTLVTNPFTYILPVHGKDLHLIWTKAFNPTLY